MPPAKRNGCSGCFELFLHALQAGGKTQHLQAPFQALEVALCKQHLPAPQQQCLEQAVAKI